MIGVSGLRMYFKRGNNFGYSKQLFLITSVNCDVSNIPPFYQSLINTWSFFSHQKVTPSSPVDGIPQFRSNGFSKAKLLKHLYHNLGMMQCTRPHVVG